jgi:hypothetical protein
MDHEGYNAEVSEQVSLGERVSAAKLGIPDQRWTRKSSKLKIKKHKCISEQ